MEYCAEKKEIVSNKSLNDLDRFVLDFLRIMEKYTDYVLVSGYVSILLGRSRASEDVDILVPEMNYANFKIMFDNPVEAGYECANTSVLKDAYSMLDEHAIRFFKETPIPNMEFKKITNSIQKEAFENRIKVILKEKTLFISPLELQIAYKLSLMAKGSLEEISSDKYFEDAKHLYETFKEKIDKEKLYKYARLLSVNKKILDFLENEIY